jgi:adhesin transport system outer membrane protein
MKKMLVSGMLGATLLWHGEAQAATMHDMLKGLTEQHPQLQAQREAVESSAEGKREAASGYYPQVALTTSWGYETVDRTETNPGGNYTNYPTESYGVSATQNLFNGLRTRATHKTARLAYDIAQTTYEQTAQQLLFEGATGYLEVLRQIELTNLSMENQNTLKNQLNLEDERVQRGSGVAVDVLQAKSRLQISKERYTAFIGLLKDAISRYTQVYGVAPDLEDMVMPALPEEHVPESLEEAIKIAEAEHPALRNASTGVLAAKAAKTAARAGYYPNIDLVASANYDDNLSGTAGEETKSSVLLKSSWNLFSGMADHARVQKSAHDYQAAINGSHYAQRKIIEEVKLAWSSLVTNRERYNLLNNAVNIAAEVFEARKRLRDAGSETALNVLDAENELFRARIDSASAQFDYYNAMYRLLLSMGRLTVERLDPSDKTDGNDAVATAPKAEAALVTLPPVPEVDAKPVAAAEAATH